MLEAVKIFVRYFAIAFLGYFANQWNIDESLIEPITSAVVAGVVVLWMIYDRFWPKKEKEE